MASDWVETTIGEFASLQRGHDLPEQERIFGAVPILGSFGVTGYHDVAKVKGPGVTVGRSGASFGVVAYSAVDYWPLNTALYVTDFHANNEKFVYYFFKTLDFSGLNSGSAQPSLNRNYVHPIKIRVPQRREQDEIAAFLSALDDKIELNRRMNATLEQMAQALFKSWFVDFDPVKAKAAGCAPEGMDADTAALFPSEFAESELGPIPKGWRCQPLSDAFEINPTRKLGKAQEANYLDMASVPTQGHRPVSWINRSFSSGTKFINGDTLLARITPCLENGKTAFVDFLPEGETGWGSTEFIVLRPKPPLPEYFAYLLCREPDFRAFAIQSMTGTSGRQRVQTDLLGKYLLVGPSGEVARRFGEIISPLVSRISRNSEETGSLAAIRDAMLPRLISGQLRIPEAESLAAGEL